MTSASSVLPAAVSAPTSAVERERHFWPAVWALGVGSFAIGTGEFVIMGLLPEVAQDLGVTIPQAGHVITAYALGVVVGAPVLAVLAAEWPRRALLMALMALFAAGNFASACAPGYVTMNLLRLLTGLPHGTYFGVAALMAASLAPPNRRASAVGLVMSGLTCATLAGVPLAAWLGQHLGWRAAFVLVGAIAVLACALIRRGVPDVPAAHGASPLRELGALARPQVWLTLGIAAIGFGGMFAVFSYVKPLLTEVTGLPIAVLACALIRRGVPDVPAAHGASPLRELGALARPQVWLTLGIAAIGFGGMFAVFSYVKPLLTEVTGLPIDGVPLVLALFGLGMVLGNLVGARLADKALMRTIGWLLAWSVVVLGAIPFTAPYAIAICANVFLLGTIVAIGPALQIRLMDTAGEAQTLAAALNHSAFNTANALGAWLGGTAIASGFGWTSTGWVGVLLAFGGIAVFGASLWMQRRMRARGEAHA